MFLAYVSEFIAFLSLKDRSLEEILEHVVKQTLNPLEVSSAFISQLNDKNQVEKVASFGIFEEASNNFDTSYDLHVKLPLTEAINQHSTVWINSLPEWPIEYPTLQNSPYNSGEKSFICFPIEKSHTPVAVLGIFSSSVIHPDAETDAFLKAIGHVMSLYMYRNIHATPEFKNSLTKRTIHRPEVKDPRITERQRIIIRMIDEGRTNLAISKLLGYSESTIRQETIKIYAKLGCNGREETAKIYREHQIHTPDFQM